ncbi:MAG: hypothetical protein JSU96_12000 [Acidobacteriota bacterium]|nr:MAG: hypothetical protein JSU96_12000 [Acidobacteriota bacterium]
MILLTVRPLCYKQLMRAILLSLLWVFTGVVLAESDLLTGYATLDVASGSSAPHSTALFQFRNSSQVLVWEAAVSAASPTDSGWILVDDQGGGRTGLALVNVSAQAQSVVLTLRDQQGTTLADRTVGLAAGQHLALFVAELFPNLTWDRLGSLEFRVTDGNEAVAAVTLRENRNWQDEAIYATLPVIEQKTPLDSESLYLPQIGSGSGLGTDVLLFNSSSATSRGTLRFYAAAGNPLSFWIDGRLQSEVKIELKGFACTKIALQVQGGVASGYAMLTADSGEHRFSGVALYRYEREGRPVSEAGVPLVKSSQWMSTLIDQGEGRVAIALANSTPQTSGITLSLLDREGVEVGATVIDLVPHGHLARFVDELFPGLPIGFTGSLDMQSDRAFSGVSLKLTRNTRSDSILTTLPFEAPGLQQAGEQLIYPQIGFGSGFSTRFYYLGNGAVLENGGMLSFYDPLGRLMPLGLRGEKLAQVSFTLPGRGTISIRPGPFLTISGTVRDQVDRHLLSGARISTVSGAEALSSSRGYFELAIPLANAAGGLDVTVCMPGYERALQVIELKGDEGSQALEWSVALAPSSEEDCNRTLTGSLPSVSVPGERLAASIGPVGLGGRLQVVAWGLAGSHQLFDDYVLSGSQTIALDFATFPEWEFEGFELKWTVGGLEEVDRVEDRFKVLGSYSHTRYNIPDEKECSGLPDPYCYTRGDCRVTDCAWNLTGQGRLEWLEEGREKGSGFNAALQFVTLEWFCANPGGCSRRFRELGQKQGCPACSAGWLAADETVAVRPDHPDLTCGDRVFIKGEGVKTVTDHGQLPELRQLDHFAGVSGCDVPTSIGRRVTVKLEQ